MNKLKQYAYRILLMEMVFVICSCDGPTKRLVSGYYLERTEDGGELFYVITSGDDSGGGVFDGTIHRIGWNQNEILAEVTRIYRGDPDGWYALNIKTGEVKGPLSESDVKVDPSLSNIVTHSCSEVMSGW